jgi:hypothetical protein
VEAVLMQLWSEKKEHQVKKRGGKEIVNKLPGENDDLGILNCGNLLYAYPYL